MGYKQISPLAVIEGGTNTDDFVNTNGTIIFDGTKLVTVSPGTIGQVFTSGGAAAPSFQNFADGITTLDADTGSAVGPIVSVVGAGNITTSATGSTLTITGTDNAGIVTIDGNTGSATGATVTISGSGPLDATASGSTVALTTTAANILNATSGSATASSNAFTIVGAGTVSTSATGSTLTITGGSAGFAWNNTTGATQAMAAENGYIDNGSGSPTVFTLPSTATVGQRVAVQGSGTGLWSIAQNAGQTIHFGVVNTTTGVGGSLAATNRYDAIFLICNVVDTDFVVQSVMGNITYV